ncbi:MAG: GGDEF domain-containing protein [Rhodoferax sp.]|nr:GGDEF domain-containing protein [Rhodoferax sp.]
MIDYFWQAECALPYRPFFLSKSESGERKAVSATCWTAKKNLSMKTKHTSRLPERNQAAKSLSQALKESEIVKEMVKESAAELALVNVTLNEEFSNRNRLHEVATALEKSEAIEIKVQVASEKLSQVNLFLEGEVKERHLLEQKLNAVIEQQENALLASLHDALTGLPNRVLFNDRLEHEIAQAKRNGWTLAVMFMDLDKFKIINDTHGHDVGDAVLQSIARRLIENTRSDDTVSRHGGDEFLYLLMEMRQNQDAAIVAKKIIKAAQLPCDVSVGQLTVSASIGISIFPKDGTTAEALIKCADAAMYRAKQNKSGYAFASDAPAQRPERTGRMGSTQSSPNC